MASPGHGKDPNLQVLRLLTALGSEGSLSRAAHRIGISQPYASRLIDRFESDHELLLVRRGPTGTTLTQDGLLVAEWATEMVRAADRLQVSMDALRAKHAEHIRIASSLSLAESLVPPILASFRADQPGVQIVLGVQNSAEVVAGVHEGRVDVGFIESPGPVGKLDVLRVGQDHLVLLAPTGHPWAHTGRPITLREIASTPLVVREEGSGTRLMYDRLMATHHLRPVQPALVLDSNAGVRSAIAGGMAPGVLSILAVTGHDSPGLVQVRADDRLRQARPLRMVWREPREGDPRSPCSSSMSVPSAPGSRPRPAPEPSRPSGPGRTAARRPRAAGVSHGHQRVKQPSTPRHLAEACGSRHMPIRHDRQLRAGSTCEQERHALPLPTGVNSRLTIFSRMSTVESSARTAPATGWSWWRCQPMRPTASSTPTVCDRSSTSS